MIAIQRELRPTDYTKSFAKLIHMILTPDEERVVEALRKVTHDSIYGQMIRDCFIDESPEKFRQLFCEILSQIDDNPSMLYQILGKDAYDSLIKLKLKK